MKPTVFVYENLEDFELKGKKMNHSLKRFNFHPKGNEFVPSGLPIKSSSISSQIVVKMPNTTFDSAYDNLSSAGVFDSKYS